MSAPFKASMVVYFLDGSMTLGRVDQIDRLFVAHPAMPWASIEPQEFESIEAAIGWLAEVAR